MKLGTLCALAAAAGVLSTAATGFASVVVNISTGAGASTQLTSAGGGTFGPGSLGGFSWQQITVLQAVGANATEFSMSVAGLTSNTATGGSISFAGADSNFSLPAASSAANLLAVGAVNSFANNSATVSISGNAQDNSPAGAQTVASVLTNQSTGTNIMYATSNSGFSALSPALTGSFSLGATLTLGNLATGQVINDVNGSAAVNAAATITPEPMSLGIIGVGLLPLVLLRRRARA